MAIFRKIHTSFWSDSFVQELTPEQKYFFLYLLTNEKTSQCGIYEISKKQICYDTGYNFDTVTKLLNFFTDSQKIYYSDSTSEIAIKNWDKFNKSDSGTVKTLVNQQLSQVKNRVLIEYLYSTDTTSIIRRRIEEEQEREEEGEGTFKTKPIELHELKDMTKEDLILFQGKLIQENLFIEPLMSSKGIKNKTDMLGWIKYFNIHIVGEGKIKKDYRDYMRHFKNWIVKFDTTKPPPINGGMASTFVPKKSVDEMIEKYK